MIAYFFIYGGIFVATGLFARIVKREWAKWPVIIVAAIGAVFTLIMIGIGVYNVITQK